MRLVDIAASVAEAAAKRRFEKRAGVVLPLAVGAMLPGIVDKAVGHYHDTRQGLDRAAYQQLAPDVAKTAAKWVMPGPSATEAAAQFAGGHAAKGLGESIGALAGTPLGGLAGGLSGVMGKGLDRFFFGREFGEKKDPLHMMGSSAMQTFGKEMGTTGAGLLRDIANKAMASIGAAGDQSAREAILKQLKKEDPVLGNADDKTLMEAFHTMQRFAPTLSTDKNAVRSFLRSAVMSGAGVDFHTIKLLGDAERSVTGEKG
jgi:hypothetical protein